MADQNHAEFGAAVAGFREALQQSWSTPQAEQQLIEAYRKYSTTLLQAWQTREVSERASGAFNEYIQRIKETFATEDDWTRIEQAFHQYARALKDAWAAVDPETMTLEEMDAIAEGMTWVTGVIKAVRRARELKS